MDRNDNSSSFLLEEKLAILEERIEIYDEKLAKSDLNINILNAQIRLLINWIHHQFGLELVNKYSSLFQHLNQQPALIDSMIASLEVKKPSTAHHSNINSQLLLAAGCHKESSNPAQEVHHHHVHKVESPQLIKNLSLTTGGKKHNLDKDQEEENNIIIRASWSEKGVSVEPIEPNSSLSKNSQLSTASSLSTSSSLRSFITRKHQQQMSTSIPLSSTIQQHKPSKASRTPGQRVEPQTKIFKCITCHAQFENSHTRLIHLEASKHGLACGHCSKILSSKITLDMHLKSHTTENNFNCTICRKSFIPIHTLRRHMKIHSTHRKKNYSCTVCSKVFYHKDNVDVHMRIHTGEKPFTCIECGERFSSYRSSKLHCAQDISKSKAKTTHGTIKSDSIT